MSQSSYETIRIEIKDKIARVSLNRPEVRNAFHPKMIKELTEVFSDLSVRKDIHAIHLSGQGKSFCSGADLEYMKSMTDFSFEENQADSQELFGMFWVMRNCSHPIVGELHGHVMGGALGLTAICDIVGAVAKTQFCFSEVKLGLAPAVISPFVLEKMNAALAYRYMLTAEIFDAAVAEKAGLVHFVGSEEEVRRFVDQTLQALKQNGLEGVRSTKSLLRQVSEVGDWQKCRELTTKVIAERRVSDEGQEGLKGFLEKRQPKWRGE